jgi:outer membrane protein
MNRLLITAVIYGLLWSVNVIAADSPANDAAPQQLVGNSTNLLQKHNIVEPADSNVARDLSNTDSAMVTHDISPVSVEVAPQPVSHPNAKTPLPKPVKAGREVAHVLAESADLQKNKAAPPTKNPLAIVSKSKNNSQSLTLEQAQAIALEHYPQIVAAEAATKAAKQEVKVSRSYYLPQVTGNAIRAFAGDKTRIGAPGGLNNPTVINRGSAGISVSQLITDFGHTSDLIESSKLELEAQKARGNLTRETVLLDATRAYYNLLRAQEMLRVAQTTLKTRHTFLEQITSLKNAKLKSNLDLSIANQLVGEASLLLLKAKSGIDDAQAMLSEALGYSESRPFTLANDTKVTPPPSDLEALVSHAMDKNPELASLRAERIAARKRAEAEGEAQYPTISALGYAGDTPIHEASQPIQPHSLVGGINVSIPFYTGGRLSAQEREASYKADIADQDLITLKNQLLRDIRIALGNAQTTYQNITVTQELVKNSNEALDLTQERYTIGSSSIVDLSQAQLAQTQAQIERANATYEYLINRALLDYKIGNGIDATVQKPSDTAY